MLGPKWSLLMNHQTFVTIKTVFVLIKWICSLNFVKYCGFSALTRAAVAWHLWELLPPTHHFACDNLGLSAVHQAFSSSFLSNWIFSCLQQTHHTAQAHRCLHSAPHTTCLPPTVRWSCSDRHTPPHGVTLRPRPLLATHHLSRTRLADTLPSFAASRSP